MLTEQNDWKELWEININNYLAQPPRTANFINHILRGKVNTILELGAGSCRDSLALTNYGYDVTASDFEPNTIKLLTEKFHNTKLKLEIIDTTNINMNSNSFDLIFHNGLFVLFDDMLIKQALIEQARVANKFILIFVHNKSNTELEKYYKRNIEKNKIYNIRFFHKEELEKLVIESGIPYESIQFYNFGGYADTFYDKKIKGLPNPLYFIAKKMAPIFYRFQSTKKTERIACLIKL